METLQKLIRTGCACISCCKDLISTPCSGNRTTFKVQLAKFSLDLEISPLIGRDHHAERAYFYLPWRYSHREKSLQCRILFGYQARIFHFSYFNISHKSSSFITWNLIEYLHTQDFQRATTHLNVWMNILLSSFVYGCKQHRKIS